MLTARLHKKHIKHCIAAAICALLLSGGANAKDTQGVMVITYRTPASQTDRRYEYEKALLRLALEKTRPTFGNYQLRPGRPMNLLRAMAMTRGNHLKNFFFTTSYSSTLSHYFAYPHYPIDRGIFGYRICFVNDKKAAQVAAAQNLNQLQRFSIGQGVGWLDSNILTYNGFTVTETSRYESLFPMVAAGRIDLFCRGISEIKPEWDTHKNIGGFSIDKSFLIYYPLPRFFWTNKANKKALTRISTGLNMAYRDGSAQELWQEYQGNYLKAISFKDRKIYRLSNPYLQGIMPHYEKFFYRPKMTIPPETFNIKHPNKLKEKDFFH